MPHKPKMVWINCEQCGEPKEVEARDRKRGWGRFCGKSCASKWWSEQKDFPLRNMTGEQNGNWKGGRTLHTKGYVYAYAPEHPRAWNGYVLEHILVAEEKLGRRLLPGERAHHKDGRKDNNHPDNIEVFASDAEHTRHHWRAGTYRRQANA